MRAFIAINLSNEVKREIEKCHYIVKENCSKSRITSIDNLHITLKFLGDINSKQLEAIKNSMKAVAGSHNRFHLSLSKWGSFRSRKGNIIWLGVDGDTKTLKDIAKQLSKQLLSVINDQSLSFKPHITVARDSFVKANIENWQQPKKINWDINHITLYESVFSNGRVTYHERYITKLGR